MSIRISAVFDSMDRADLAIRSLLDNGIRIHGRRTTPVYGRHQGGVTNGSAFLFAPMATSSYMESGMSLGGFFNEPGYGSALYAGMIDSDDGPGRTEGPREEVQLEVDVDESRAQDAVAILTSGHGSFVQRY